MEKQERKQRKILTDNRLVTVNRRETSFEGLALQLEGGEDSVHNLINENKNQIYSPRIYITKADIEEIPFLKQIREAIKELESVRKNLTGKLAFVVKKTIIELHKEQYLVKTAYRKPISARTQLISKFPPSYPDWTAVDPDTNLAVAGGVSLVDPQICSFILCNYSKLKEASEERLNSDLWALMKDFDNIAEIALADWPLYEKIIVYKVDGLKLTEISKRLEEEFGIKHTIEYISTLWRNKIPKMIASVAEDQWLEWYYTNEEKGKWKKCSRCGQIKLANNKNFSKNKTSLDSFYSICKKCRNAKTKEMKQKNG